MKVKERFLEQRGELSNRLFAIAELQQCEDREREKITHRLVCGILALGLLMIGVAVVSS